MGLSPTFGARRFPKGERKELWCARRRKPFFRPGLTRRLRRGRWGCRLMGFHQLRCLKVSKGRAESPLVRPLAHTSCRRRGGLTRRLRRGSRACSPMGRSHFSFGGERKVCKRKPAARRLREKALDCPFCRRGSLCRAQHGWPAFTCDPARSELAFFRHQNGRAFFPPLPIAALAPAVGVRHTQPLRIGMLWRGGANSAGPQASGFWKQCWPFARAARPSVERRSVSASWQEITPDPRAARPVAERR